MREVFISHSSKDKAMYADYLAEHLGARCNYDAYTFETGGKTEEEIIRCIEESKLHVVLLSKNSLQSEWVQKELKLIYDKLGRSKFDAFFPIIIDNDINHDDERIPQWIKESYNLKPISKPSSAVHKIKNKLASIMYTQSTFLQKRKIFAGRNDEMKIIEERMNDLDKDIVRCLVVSGLHGSGRKTLIKEAIIKNNIADKYNNPIVISLNRQMSIEDLIQQCSPFSTDSRCDELAKLPMEDKIDLLSSIFMEMQNQRLFLIIDDAGCIVNGRGEIAYWLVKAVKNAKNEFTLGIASQYKVDHFKYRRDQFIFCIEISTLSKTERNLLLKACVEAYDLELTQEDLRFVSGLLKGFPDQVYYAVDLIKEYGIDELNKRTYLMIVDYSKDRVQEILKQFATEDNILNFLSLLSNFDFASISFIKELTKEQFGIEFLPHLLNINLVERFGAFGEYLKLNDAVKDFMQRAKFKTTIDYVSYLQKQMKSLKDSSGYIRELDIDELNVLIRASFEEDNDVTEFAIPSHYLKTIIDLYNASKYRDVIKLVDKLKDGHTIDFFDERISAQIYDYFCLSLSRERSERVWDEVKNIKEPADYYFMLAFAYKKLGKNKNAYEMAKKAINYRPLEKAKRLLVDVLNQCCAYDEALIYARENYDNRPNNPYHIQAYFNCLLRKAEKDVATLEALIDKMRQIQSEMAKEMLCEMEARYWCEVNKDCTTAISHLQSFMKQDECKSNRYLYMTLFDVYLRDGNLEAMKQLLETPEFANMKNILDTRNNYYFREACYEFVKGENLLVIQKTLEKMHFISDDYRQTTLERIKRKAF